MPLILQDSSRSSSPPVSALCAFDKKVCFSVLVLLAVNAMYWMGTESFALLSEPVDDDGSKITLVPWEVKRVYGDGVRPFTWLCNARMMEHRTRQESLGKYNDGEVVSFLLVDPGRLASNEQPKNGTKDLSLVNSFLSCRKKRSLKQCVCRHRVMGAYGFYAESLSSREKRDLNIALVGLPSLPVSPLMSAFYHDLDKLSGNFLKRHAHFSPAMTLPRRLLLFRAWERLSNFQTAVVNLMEIARRFGGGIIVEPFVFEAMVRSPMFIDSMGLNFSEYTLSTYFSTDNLPMEHWNDWVVESSAPVWALNKTLPTVGAYVLFDHSVQRQSPTRLTQSTNCETGFFPEHDSVSGLSYNNDLAARKVLCFEGFKNASPELLGQLMSNYSSVALGNYRKYMFTNVVKQGLHLGGKAAQELANQFFDSRPDFASVAVHIRAARVFANFPKEEAAFNNAVTGRVQWARNLFSEMQIFLLSLVSKIRTGKMFVYFASDMLNQGTKGGDSVPGMFRQEWGENYDSFKNTLRNNSVDVVSFDLSQVQGKDKMGIASVVDGLVCIRASLLITTSDSLYRVFVSPMRRNPTLFFGSLNLTDAEMTALGNSLS